MMKYHMSGRNRMLRGQAHERRVFRIHEDVDVAWWVVRGFKGSADDEWKGVDGWFLTDRGAVPLQVKSNYKRAQEHRKKYPHVPVVVVMRHETDQQLRDRVYIQLSDFRQRLSGPARRGIDPK